MDYLSAIIYGFIQGATEFLPVSSSGHLALLPYFLEIKDPGVVFDLMMHLGTALSVIVYYRKNLWQLLFPIRVIFQDGPKSIFTNDRGMAHLKNFVLTTITTVGFVFLIKNWASTFGRTPEVIASNLILFGILLYLIDRYSKQDNEHNKMMNHFHPKMSFLIGLSQALAVFPGVSRSGITITAARGLGLSREEATHYSFMLSLPIIIGGIIFLLPEFLRNSEQISIGVCLMGVLTAFIVGLLAIHLFISLVKRMGLLSFAIYRFILGVALLMYLN